MSKIDVERVIRCQDRMYIIHLRNITIYNLSLVELFITKIKVLHRQEALHDIQMLQEAIKIIAKIEREAESYFVFSFGDTHQQVNKNPLAIPQSGSFENSNN